MTGLIRWRERTTSQCRLSSPHCSNAQALSEACSTLEQSCLQGQWPADAASQVTGIMQFAVKTCEALQDFMAQTGPAAD